MSIEEISKISNIEELYQVVQKVTDIDILSNNLGSGKNNALILYKDFLYNMIIEQKNRIEQKNSI